MANSPLINIDTPVSVIDASVFKMGPNQVLYKNEEVATVAQLAQVLAGLNNLMDDYIKLQTRVADIDLLPEVATMADGLNHEKYGRAIYETNRSLERAGYVITEDTVGPITGYDNCFLSLNELFARENEMSVFPGVKKWYVDLPSLVSCHTNFSNGPVDEFTGNLPNLKKTQGMFEASNLEEWDGVLSSLECGMFMFQNSRSLRTFVSGLGNLVNGSHMFYVCTELENFEGGLGSLLEGENMFASCALTKQSVSNIAAGINYVADLSWATLDEEVKTKYELTQNGFKRLDIGVPAAVVPQITTEANIIVSRGWDLYINGVKHEPTPPNA